MSTYKYILEFTEVNKESIAEVGGKGANLGEMTQAGFPVPQGFFIPASAYRLFIEENNFKKQIKDLLKTANLSRPKELQAISEKIRAMLVHGEIPALIQKEAITRYQKMGSLFRYALVAVRSSATAEDLPGASFAGQQETYLNISGEANLLNAIRDCWASLFTPRAIFYREEKKFDHFKVSLAAVVQEMVQSEVSGIAFTADPMSNDKNRMVIEAIWGLGELIVQGSVTPDKYILDRHTLEILEEINVEQTVELIKKGNKNKEEKVPASRQKRKKLTEENIKALARILQKVHAHYYFPQDIEWAYKKGKFYIIQARPITTLGSENSKEQTTKEESKSGEVLLQGHGASPGIVTGVVKIVQNPKNLSKVKKGDILVAEMTSPDYVPAMKIAGAIVTDKGGVTSHAAIVSRELGIACIVGTGEATKILKDGMVVTVNAKAGVVYKGKLKNVLRIEEKEKAITDVKARTDIKTATKIYVNLAEPERAAEVAKLPVDGVGLLRAEFMIAEIGVHPKHLIAQGRQEEFVTKLATGLTEFCKNFEPRNVIYRATDFKTNEYRNLDGGRDYEPEEPNPMLGFRGAFRYINDAEVFELELASIKRVRETYKNLMMMIPFVRSPAELLSVKRIMAASGLVRSPSFKLWMMVELPVNIILIDEFIGVGIDGISIGSNDLTMLLQGTDRDNAEVATAFNELSPEVTWSLERVIKAARKHGITSSICGQAASTYDSLVENLVKFGITSVSVNPDAVGRTQKMIYETERRLIK
ncbi:MAG: phosphoenolpyruvate synthase [bacterium]|nr:phosphoenolpyruvate synthase [bacterium]